MGLLDNLLKIGGRLMDGEDKDTSAPEIKTVLPKVPESVVKKSDNATPEAARKMGIGFESNLGIIPQAKFQPSKSLDKIVSTDFSKTSESEKAWADETAKYLKEDQAARDARLKNISETSTNLGNTAAFGGLKPLGNKIKQIRQPQIAQVRDFDKRASFANELGANAVAFAAPFRTVGNILGAGASAAWDHTAGRLFEDIDDRKRDIIQENIKEKTTSKFLTTKTNNDDNTLLGLEHGNIVGMSNEIEAGRSEIALIEKELATINPWDTNYVQTKKLLNSKKYSIEQKNAVLLQKAKEFEDHRQEVLAKETERDAVLRGYYKDLKSAEHYNKTVGKDFFWKDGRLYGADDPKEKSIKAFVSRYEERIFGELGDIDEDNAKGGIATNMADNEEFLGKLGYTLKGMRDYLDDNYDKISVEMTTPGGYKYRVIDGNKVEDFLTDNAKQSLGVMSDYISKSRVKAAEKSLTNVYKDLKDETWIERQYDAALRFVDFGFKANTQSTKDTWAPDYKSWASHAAQTSTMAGDLGTYLITNPSKVAATISAGVLSFGGTAISGTASAAGGISEAALATSRAARISNFITTKVPGFRGILTEGSTIAQDLSLASRVQKAGIGLTKNKDLNSTINFIVRKGAGFTDEMLVSTPLDLVTSDEGDMRMNIGFNMLGGFGKIGKLDDISRMATEISRVGDTIAREKLWNDMTGLKGVAIDLEGDAQAVERNIKRVVKEHQESTIGTNKNKSAIFMLNYINGGIDRLTYDNAKQIYNITTALESSKELGVTLSKNTAKDINRIMMDTDAKVAAAKTLTQQNEIKAAGLEAIKKRFKRMSSSFDMGTLDKLYNKKISEEFAKNSFSSLIDQFSKATGEEPEFISLFLAEQIIKGKGSSDMRKLMLNRITERRATEAATKGETLDMAKEYRSLEKTIEDIPDQVIDDVANAQLSARDTPEDLGKTIREIKEGTTNKPIKEPVQGVTLESSEPIKDRLIKGIKVSDEEIEAGVKTKLEADIGDVIAGTTKEFIPAKVIPELSIGDQLVKYDESTKKALEKLSKKEDIIAQDLAKKEADKMFDTAAAISTEIKAVNNGVIPAGAKERTSLFVNYVQQKYGLDVTSSPMKDIGVALLRNTKGIPAAEVKAVEDELRKGLYKISSNPQGELVSKGTVKTVAGDSEFKLAGKSSTTENFETSKGIYNKYKRINDEIGGAMADVATAENTANIIKTTLSKVGKARSGLTEDIMEGLQKFLDSAKTNGAMFARVNLPEGVKGIFKIIDGDSAKKVMLGLSGSVMDKLSSFSKLNKPTSRDIVNISDSLGTLFHEVGHLVSTSITPEIKDGIVRGMRQTLLGTSNELLIDNISNMVGAKIFDARFDHYKNLADGKQYDLLMEEIFADKMQRDLHSAIFSPDEYENTITKSLGIFEDSEQKGLVGIIQKMDIVVKQVADYFKKVIKISGWMGGGAGVEDIMSLLNFSVIKGQVDIKLGGGRAGRSETYFQKVSEGLDPLDVPGLDYVNNEQGTLLRMGLREETLKLADALKNNKSVTISAEFLNPTGLGLIFNILSAKTLNETQYAKLIDTIKSSKIKINEDVTAAYYMTNKLFDASKGVISTNKGGATLNSILKSLPTRLTRGVKSMAIRAGGVVIDARLSLIKYMLESNPDTAGNILQGFYNSYLKKQFSTYKNQDVLIRFLSHTNPKAVKAGQLLEGLGEGLMGLYKGVKSELLKLSEGKNLSKEMIEDILNPILYSPMEYIGAIGRMDVLKGDTIEDIVLGVVLNKRRNYDEGATLLMSKNEMTKKSKLFNSMAKGAGIRNAMVMDMGDEFGKFLDRNPIDIPLTKSAFGEWSYKNMGYIIHNDDAFKGVSMLENTTAIIRRSLENSRYPEDFIKQVEEKINAIVFDEKGRMNPVDTQRQNIVELKKTLMEGGGMKDKDISEAISALDSSLDVLNSSKGTRILSDFLLNKLHDKESYKVLSDIKSDIKSDELVLDIIEQRKQIKEGLDKRVQDSRAESFLDDLSKIPEGETKEAKAISEQERKKLIEGFGLSDQEIEEVNRLGGIDVEKILNEDGKLSGEDQINFIYSQMLSGKMSYNRLINTSEPFRDMLRVSFDKAAESMAKREDVAYYTIDKMGSLSERFEGFRNNWLDRITSRMTSIGKVTQSDSETQGILGRVIEQRRDGWLKSDLDLSKYMNGKVSHNHSIQAYLSAVKKNFRELTMGKSGLLQGTILKKNVIEEQTVGKIVDSVFGKSSYTIRGVDEQALYDFLIKYKSDIDGYRKKFGLGDVWGDVGVVGNKKLVVNKIGNRMTGLWNFMSKDDISRLGTKYGDAGDSKALLGNFVPDVVFGGRLDVADGTISRGLGRLNMAAMRIEMKKMFGPRAAYKIGQQIFSNEVGASAIIKSIMGSNTNALKEVEGLITSKAGGKNFGFNLFETEGVQGEFRGVDRAAEGNKPGTKGMVRNIWEFMTGKNNVLVIGDAASQRSARLSSLAMALEDTYKVGGEDAVIAIHKKIEDMYVFMDKFGLKETDFLNKVNFDNRMTEKIFKNAQETAGGKAMNFAMFQMHNEKNTMYDFYRNTYSPLIGKTRANMGVFYVMDNIPELGSIRAIDKYKRGFGLMKRAMGKTGEYATDIIKAVKKYPMTAKGVIAMLDEPIFSRMFNDIAGAAKIGRLSDRLTGGEMDYKTVTATIAIPMAAFGMFIGSTIYDNIYKYGLLGSQGRGEGIGEGILSGAEKMLGDLAKRMFIYVGFLSNDLHKIWTTAETGKDPGDQLALGLRSLYKQAFGNTLSKFTNFSSAGYQTSAQGSLNISTIVSEYLFNSASKPRQAIYDIANSVYGFSSDEREGDTDAKPINKLLSLVPGIRESLISTPDQGVLMSRFDEYKEETGVEGFIKSGVPMNELMRLVDQLEINTMKKDPKFKDANISEGLKSSDLLTAGITVGALKEDLASFKIITDGLESKDATSKDMISGWMETLKPEEKQLLTDEFNKMFQSYITDKGKGDYNTESQQREFVAMASKFGGTMAIGGYLKAYANGFKKQLADYYGLKTKEISAGKAGDALFMDTEVNGEGLTPTTQQGKDYIQYVNAVREEEKRLIINNRDWIQGEKHIGIDLMNKYIENDIENFPLGKYGSAIGEAKNNFSKILGLKQLDELGAQQGYSSLMGPIAYMQMKGLDFVNNIHNKTQEQITEAGKRFIGIQKQMLDWIGEIQDPTTREATKAGIAGGMMKYMSVLSEKTPEVIDATIAGIGKDHVLGIIDRLTDSPPVVMKTAFEQITGVNTHGGGEGSSGRIPAAKDSPKKGVDMILASYNKLAGIAVKASPYPDLNPKYKYERQPDGSISATRIVIDPIKDRFDGEQIRHVGTATAKLDVTPLPVKEGRVLSGSYGARAIKGAKVYSRKIGGKKI